MKKLLFSILTVIIVLIVALPIQAQSGSVTLVPSSTIAANQTFDIVVHVDNMGEFDSISYALTPDSGLQIVEVVSSTFNDTLIPISFNTQGSTTFVLHNVQGIGKLSGTGDIATIKARATGTYGTSYVLRLTNGVIANSAGQATPATWHGTTVTVNSLPGDANGDGVLNALDITKIERMVVKLDAPTATADTNHDGQWDALDVTRIELAIVGLIVLQ